MLITIESVDASTSSHEWDSFVRSCPGWTHFHLAGWQRIMSEVWRHETIYLAAKDEDKRLCGVLPLVRVRSRVFGHFLCSLPFVSYGGPLGTPTAVEQLAAYAVVLAKESSADLLEFRCYQQQPVALDVSHRKITVVMDLPSGGEPELLRVLDSKVRSQARKPFKEGFTVKFGNDQIEPFFKVFSEHMRDLGTPTQPLRLFQKLAEVFPDDCLFGCGWIGGRPVAAGCGFRWGSEFEITWASSLKAYSKLSPNMGLYLAFMLEAQRQGVSRFNFGRCTPNGGTHRFKRQWGAHDVQLWWYQASRGITKTPSPDDDKFALGPKVWKKLPLAAATALGPSIVRLIP